jgi:hypothetical protein
MRSLLSTLALAVVLLTPLVGQSQDHVLPPHLKPNLQLYGYSRYTNTYYAIDTHTGADYRGGRGPAGEEPGRVEIAANAKPLGCKPWGLFLVRNSVFPTGAL